MRTLEGRVVGMARCVAAALVVLWAVGALECDPAFWPEVSAWPRRLETLILADGRLVKLCFDPDADGEVHRNVSRAFLAASGFGPLDATNDAVVDDAVEALVDVLFVAKVRRRNPTFAAVVGAAAPRGFGDAFLPDVAFELVPRNDLTVVDARAGEGAGAAAARSCARFVSATATACCPASDAFARKLLRVEGVSRGGRATEGGAPTLEGGRQHTSLAVHL